jgi:type IV fimbrial biogenesis protein FimT
MVVVVMVAILAVLAVPQVTERLRERRSSEAAQRIASLYRTGRMRALGRGAAVLIRYDADGFRVYEAIQDDDAAAGCEQLPSSSCLTTDWNDADQRHEVTVFNPKNRGEYEDVRTTVSDPGGTAREELDVCFTPVGRAYLRTSDAEALGPMMGVATVAVSRGAGSLTRRVSVLPNGIARLAL